MVVKDCTDYEDLGPDPYTVVRVLGTGPDGTTQIVKLGDNSVLYVRKIIVAELANVDAWRALAQVSHPLVPRVYEQCWRNGAYEVVYDYIPGESLRELVERNALLNERYAASILLDVAEAAGALHAAGIVHRDISPGNVVIDRKGRAHLTDLGIARLVNDGGRRDTTNLGTRGFSAPEQYGFAQTDARSDVYSMGCLLAYACTGVMPEVGIVPDEVLSTLSPGLSAVIKKACAFEPSARYQSATEFANALVASMGSMPIVVESGASAADGDVPAERGPAWLRIVGWTVFVCVAFFGAMCIVAGLTNVGNTEGATEPGGNWPSIIMVIALGAACIYCAVQTFSALKLRGKYAPQKGRIKKLLLEYVKAAVTWIVFFVVSAILFTAVVTALKAT